MSASETERGTWLATGPAAARLGITADGLRKQIRRGKYPYPTRRDNRGIWEVCVPAGLATVSSDSRGTVPDTRDAELAELRATVDGLRGQLESVQALVEAQRMHVADVRGELGDAKAERDRLLVLLESTLAERRPERRPWPGLKAWWRRVWEGEG